MGSFDGYVFINAIKQTNALRTINAYLH